MSEELQLLRDSAQRFAADSGLCASDAESWQTISDLGWLLVSVPDSQGGMGLGLGGAMVLHQALGSSLNGAAYLPQMLAISALASSGPKPDSLIELMSGERRVAVSLQASTLTVSEAKNSHQLSGVAEAVLSADVCDRLLLCTSSVVALLDRRAVGVSCAATPVWDESRMLFDITLSEVAVGEEQTIAVGEEAARLCSSLATSRDLAIAADCLGGANALFEKTLEHLRTRTQFGRPIGMFQALKHRCADLKAQLNAAEAVMAECLGLVDSSCVANQQNDRALNISIRSASLLAKRVYLAVAEESLQLHGGIGMTAEHYCHLYLKRAMLNEHLGCAPDGHCSALAAQYLS